MSCVAILLVATCVAIAISRMQAASSFVYGLTLLSSLTALFAALVHLIGGAPMSLMVTLPLGLPWLGAHFQMDALAAFFIIVVNLGAAVASLFALGYGRHEDEPHRVLPFYPAFVAGMNLGCLLTMLSLFWLPGSLCRFRRGRWSWPIIAPATTRKRDMFTSLWPASVRSRFCWPTVCLQDLTAATPSPR